MNPFKNAEWIFCDTDDEVIDKAFIYETDFDISADAKIYLYISAYTQYTVYINGEFADAGQYDGYEDYQVYDTLDITPFVRMGKNRLTVWHYVCGEDFAARQKQIPGLIFSVTDSKGNELVSSSAECRSVHDARVLGLKEKMTVQLCYTLDFDSNVALNELRPSVPAGKKKLLYPRPIKKLITDNKVSGRLIEQGIFTDNAPDLPKAHRMQKAVIGKRSFNEILTENENGISWSADDKCSGAYLLYDCDESAGLLSFSFELPQSAEILIGFGEHLDDGRVRTAIADRNFCFRYIAHAGKNEFFYPLCRIGLRYLSFYIYSPVGTVNYAGIRKQHYPLERRAVDYPNALHRRIYEVGCDTLELCMHEHYEDCPWREQSLYAMDSRVQTLCGYYAFGEYEFPAASFRLMARSLRPDGLLELCPPGKVPLDIPSFTAVYVREILEYTEYSGKKELAAELFDALKTIVEGFSLRISDNGLLPLYKGSEYWNFYEWRDGLDGAQTVASEIYDSPLNAFVYDAFVCFARICELLDKNELALKYRSKAEGIKNAVNSMFWDEKNGAYRTLPDEEPRHILTQGLMLYTGIAPEDKRAAVAARIAENKYIPCSLSMSIYVYEALLRYSDSYKEYVLKQIEKIWGAMLESGCQTFWETELGADDFDKAGSLCHGWSAVPVYLFGKYFY